MVYWCQKLALMAGLPRNLSIRPVTHSSLFISHSTMFMDLSTKSGQSPTRVTRLGKWTTMILVPGPAARSL